MVLGITPSTKFVYSLKDLSSSERSFGIEKGRRADINSARYYEKNL